MFKKHKNLKCGYRYSRKRFKRFSKLSIKEDRLINNHGEPESVPLKYLAQRGRYDKEGEMGTIKGLILCMDGWSDNYRTLPEDKKLLVKKLWDNEEVVDIVLISIFQWFGTSCGRADMSELLEEVDKGVERMNRNISPRHQEKLKKKRERTKEIKQIRERAIPLLEGQSERVRKALEKVEGIRIEAHRPEADHQGF